MSSDHFKPSSTHTAWVCPRCGEIACPTPNEDHAEDGRVGRVPVEYVAVDALLSEDALQAARSTFGRVRDQVQYWGASESGPTPLEAAITAAVEAVRS